MVKKKCESILEFATKRFGKKKLKKMLEVFVETSTKIETGGRYYGKSK